MSSLLIHEPLHYAVCKPEASPAAAQDVLLSPAISVQASMLAGFPSLPSLQPWLPAGLPGLLSLFLKGAMDVFLGAVLLVLTAPCFLAIMAVSSLDGGPIFFAHRRVGIGGRPFHCLKFRTMVVDAERVLDAALAQDPVMAAEWMSSRKLNRDPRITPFGRFLRKTSLDELPQLINVLRRDMSLVGPRPIVENEVHLYGANIAQYHAMRPGLTGLWQISGRSSVSYGRRVELDIWYVNNRTIWRDLVVLLKTVPVVLRRQGAC